MNNMGKKLLALLTAAVMVTPVALSACTPGDDSDEYAVVLNYNDGQSRPYTMYVDKGSSIDKSDISEPLREGYSFTEWTDAAEEGTAISFPFTPERDTTIYAQWDPAVFGVVFDYGFEGSPDPVVIPTEYAKSVDDPFDTEIKPKLQDGAVEGQYVHADNEGYFTRGEWETANGSFATFPYMVKKETSFTLHWYSDDVVFYYIHFDSNYPDGSKSEVYSPIEVQGGDRVTNNNKVPKPTFRYYKFEGWATSPNATKNDLQAFPFVPTESMTLYAVWTQEEYKINFKYNHMGNAVNPASSDIIYQTISTTQGGTPLHGGDKITAAPAAPERVHGSFTFEFDGWYTSEVGGIKVDFPYEVTGNADLYAHWLAPMTTTDTFDAEFVFIDPAISWPGYSGEGNGTGIIFPDDGTNNAKSADYPLINGATHQDNFISYMYVEGASITFKIHSSAAASNVTLYASLALEFTTQAITFTPDGDFGFQFLVNGTSVNYSATVTAPDDPMGHSEFKEYQIANISLKEGWNEITLRVNNSNTSPFGGGTFKAAGPMVDYIRLDTKGGATLSWRPEYDNLYRTI